MGISLVGARIVPRFVRRRLGEVDGDKYHSDRKARSQDRRRNNELIVQGYLYLRFSCEDIMINQDYVLDRVRVVLSGRVIR